ncbi:MAG TPA: DUF6629 family protein [Anaerolineales bacterium]|nr:DUF6629 family protein [Anaerolineales bacterium]
MCYSAEASFVASGVLAGTSIAISRLPKEKTSLLLSAVPAIFAVHQFIEGSIWLNQGKIEVGISQAVAVFAYALIAYVFWPVFIPLAAYFMEVEKRRRIWMLICQAVGLGTGLAYLLSIIRSPVQVSVNVCSLSYNINAPDYLLATYLLAVAVPFLVSSRRGLVRFGLLILISFAAAFYLASNPSFPSVWCFFAAMMSFSLYFFFRASVPEAERQPEQACPQHR